MPLFHFIQFLIKKKRKEKPLTQIWLWWFNPQMRFCWVSRGLRLASKHLYIMSHTPMPALFFAREGVFFLFFFFKWWQSQFVMRLLIDVISAILGMKSHKTNKQKENEAERLCKQRLTVSRKHDFLKTFCWTKNTIDKQKHKKNLNNNKTCGAYSYEPQSPE